MESIISVKNLGKSYDISRSQGKYIALRDVIANAFKNPFRFISKKMKNIIGRGAKERFWALKDVNFEIAKGEVVGIIGKNGAGKSTLLKILTGITPPTEGEIVMRGHVASLLEVGTGFHPELTGRENIFLNGAILGMKKTAIAANFESIVEFAGIEKFLDTPVKYYSSGMYVRLAFSVAAHLEPDILLVDEVLAVGDIEFQKKCLGKMQEVTMKHGRTILFVSHNMAAIQSLCKKTILIEKGQVKAIGPTEEIVNLYMSSEGSTTTEMDWEKTTGPRGNDVARLFKARLIDEKGSTLGYVSSDKKFGVEIEYEVLKPGFAPVPNVHFFTSKGEYAFISHMDMNSKLDKAGKHTATVWIPGKLLNTEKYIVGIALSTMQPLSIHTYERESLIFDVIDDVMAEKQSDFNHRIPGVIRPVLEWNIE
ncbi:MAG: polysaccharide ABC transporter ATP-binding protein [Patescibacteria group bacterium]